MRRFNMYGDEADDETGHAYCAAYGHEWRKSHILSAKAKPHITIEVCKRCDETRRVANVRR
jgi:hypothetical protein